MADSSEVGRFGTLRLLKRHDPETTIAFFPIDDEEVTFGRSRDCSIRLYYDCISELHCTLRISEERKAFLTVQGTNGIIVDGCEVKPKKTEGFNSTTVPLTNGSVIEIYRKRFKFEYPSKDIRAALLATPRDPKRRRSLRMSMIQSAQVFTPRVNAKNNPRTSRLGNINDNVDWQALRNPVKIPSNDNSMIILEGNGDDALVVEEEKDLIILEHVDDPHEEPPQPQSATLPFSPGAHPSPAPTPPPPPSPVRGRPPQTPPNRRQPGLSLHRAVVLRSAQRAQLNRDRARQREKQEEQEVELAVSPERELGPFELHPVEDDGEEDEEDIKEDKHTVFSGMRTPLGVLKAGLHLVKSFTIDRLSPENVPLPEDESNASDEVRDEDENCHYEADEDTVQSQTPIRRNLGPFMTPQVAFKPAQRVPIDVKPRASVGGESFAPRPFGGPRRIPVDEAWKLNDIALPNQQKFCLDNQGLKLKITEEERQTILQRRKSALQTPSGLPKPGPRNTLLDQSEGYTPGEDIYEDTDTMLERMREKMDRVRRKSEARKARLSLSSPHKQRQGFSLFAAGPARNEMFSSSKISEETYNRSEATDEEHNDVNQTPTASYTRPVSHTPRFDGVREMFRQPAMEPKTPSFTGFRKMFDGVTQPHSPPKTPSFAGMKRLFNSYPANVVATPHMNLDEVFEQDENDHEDEEPRPVEEDQDPLQKEARSTPIFPPNDDAITTEKGLNEVDLTPPPPRGRRTKKTSERDVESDAAGNSSTVTKATRKTARGLNDDPPQRTAPTRITKTKKVATSSEGQEETVPVKPPGRRTRKQQAEEAAAKVEGVEGEVEPPAAHPGVRRGRRGKTPTPQPAEEPRIKAEPVEDVESAAPKPARRRRGAKPPLDSADVEEVNPPKTRRTRKDAAATLLLEEGDKENSEDQSAAVVKTTTRNRRAVATSEEIPAPPARRTRSRK